MQVFKNKTFKNIMSAIVLVALIIVCYIFFSDMLSDVTYNSYFEHDLKTIEKNNEDVDVIFVGASKIYMSMIPSVFEEKLDVQNAIVAATATQLMPGTYYYMQDLIERFHPDRFVIDVNWDRMMNGYAVQPDLIVYDRLSLKNKISFVKDCFNPKDYCYLLKPCRYRGNFLELSTVRADKKRLKEMNYTDYKDDGEYYREKGYIYSYSNYSQGTVPIYSSDEFFYSDDLILEENVEYLEKCIELCKENGIEVTLVTCPCSLSYLYFVKDYELSVEWYKNFANEHGVEYVDLNYLKNREEILSDEYMYDNCHISADAAPVISDIYSDILLAYENGEDISDLFYSDFEELKKDVHRIVSVRGTLRDIEVEPTVSGTYEAKMTLECLKNEWDGVLYQIECSTDYENYTVLSEWSGEPEAEIELPALGGFSLKVRAKTLNEGDAEAYQIYYY